MTDIKLLRNRIEDSGYKLRFIAGKLGISYQCFLNKLNNLSEFKTSEISMLSNLLSLTKEELVDIFFR